MKTGGAKIVLLATASVFPLVSASAQTFSDADSRYAYIGPGNVEAKTGTFTYQATDLSVGSGSFPSRMEFQRWKRSTVVYGLKLDIGDFAHNFTVSVGCKDGSGVSGSDVCPYPNERAVRIGPQAYLFSKSGSDWVSQYGDGTQLLEEATRWVFRGKFGDQIIFPKDSSFYDYAATTHLASLWQFPDGQFVTFFYEVANSASFGWNARRRLAKVVNSRGYGFQLSYLLPGGGTTHYPFDDNNDYRKRTISSVSAIAPGCVTGTTTSCATTPLGSVNYSYSNWATGSPSLRLDSVTDPRSNTSSFQWDTNRYLVSQTNPAVGGSYLFQNQMTLGAVTQQTDPTGNVWLYRRTTDGSGNIISAEIEDPDHKITKYGFSIGMVAPDWIDDPYNKRTKYTYDSMGRLASVESPLGTKTAYANDSRGNITTITLTPAASGANDQPSQQITYSYPTCDATNWRICNKPTSISDQRSGVTSFTYNVGHGGTETILGPGATAAARPLTKFTFDTRVRAPTVETSSSTAPLPDITVLTQIERCLSSNGTITYSCPSGDSIKTSYSYDASTITTRTQFLLNTVTADPGAINAATAFKYDVVGNLTWADGPRSDGDITTFEFDKNRYTTKTIAPDPDGGGPLAAPETSFTYDAIGNQTSVRRKLGVGEEIFSATYNAARQVTQTSNPETGTVNYSYDIVGRPTEAYQTVDGQTRKTQNVYDALGRVTQTKSMLGGTLQPASSYTYDDDSHVTSLADGKGNTTNYCYDGYGRMVEMRYPSTATPGTSLSCPGTPIGSLPSTADFQRIHYDASSNPTSVRVRDNTTATFQYDALNHMTFKDVPDTDRDVTYSYDLLGRMTAASLPGTNAALSVSWSYDKIDRVVSSSTLGRSVGYSYTWAGQSTVGWPDGKYMIYQTDPLGRPSTVTGIQQSAGGGGFAWPTFATYSYDQLSRPTTVDYGNSTQTTYNYDATRYLLSSLAQNLAGTANDASWSFSYNEAGQIAQRTLNNDAYAWTGSYNVSKSYAANGLNQYATAGNIALSHDRRGNVTGGGGFAFVYDSDNRLTSSSGPGASNLTYDAIGRLARIISNGQTTEFLYDGDRLIGEYDGTGALVRRTIPGPSVDEPLGVYDGPGTASRQRLYRDWQGSIVALTDDTGNATKTMGYGGYGEASLGMGGRFGYTGQMRMSEMGDLYYYKARFYSPRLGRFLQTDPIGYDGGLNLYAYVGNDPVNLTDPMGLDPCYDGTNDICATVRRPKPSGGSGSGSGVVNIGGWSLSSGWGALNSLIRNAPINFARISNMLICVES
jgi:RHS repeat-associated protein